MMDVVLNVRVSNIDANTWVKVSSKIIERVCGRRCCRIGFREGVLVEVNDMLMEFRYRVNEYCDPPAGFVVLECLITKKDPRQLVVCLDSAYVMLEEIMKVVKWGEENDNRKSGSI